MADDTGSRIMMCHPGQHMGEPLRLRDALNRISRNGERRRQEAEGRVAC
jgi:hypothetical protein